MSLNNTRLYHAPSKKKSMGLNLVSLMDIFTILVFFLLMNSGESQEIESAKFIKLPDSQAKGAFSNELLVTINDEFILLDGKEVVPITDVLTLDGKTIPALVEKLKEHSEIKGELNEFEKKNGRSVTILGDKAIPYGILRSVMASCSQENYRDIALAVNQVISGVVEVNQ